eukprot:jgi/Hompol1/5353/HPOL_001468-RA
MASGSERLDIASAFVRESPPGEINDVFNDVRVLVGDDAQLQTVVAAAFEQHHTDQFIAVPATAGDYQVILGVHGRIAEGQFIDPRANELLTVDLMHQTVTRSEPNALDTAVATYAANSYHGHASTVWVSEDGALVIAIVANKFSPENFWSARWRSEWTVQPGSANLTGWSKVQVHYYEDGNVQQNSSKQHSATVTVSEDPSAFAAAVVKQITKHETEFQMSLNDKHNSLATDTFKSLRRVLPITRTKVEWQSILSYKVGSELASK